MLKRFFDVIISLLALIVLSPIFPVIAVLIKFDSRGPVFYKSLRVGRRGKEFYLYKFRTMKVGADKMGSSITYNTDPRITRIGKSLRKTKIDECPQFLNVLKGEISLVGPRPETPAYVKLYNEEQRKVLTIKPGITGLAQIKFPDEEALLTEGDFYNEYVNKILPQKLKLDLEYMKKCSLLLDFKILLRTLLVLIK